MSTWIAAPVGRGRTEQAQSAESALLGPMSSDWGDTLTHTLVAEPYSPGQVRTGALKAGLYSESRVPRAGAACTSGHASGTVKRPRDTSPRLHAATCIFGRWTGRIEHLARALRRSPTDTLDRISRGGEVEGHEHGDCNAGGLSRRTLQMQGASAESALCSGPWARIDVKLWPMHSWLSRTARVRCKRELYRPSYTPKAAYRVLARLARALPPRGDVTERPWDTCAWLLTQYYVYGRWTGRIEHLAGALRRSPTDTLDRISRGDEVEGHE